MGSINLSDGVIGFIGVILGAIVAAAVQIGTNHFNSKEAFRRSMTDFKVREYFSVLNASSAVLFCLEDLRANSIEQAQIKDQQMNNDEISTAAQEADKKGAVCIESLFSALRGLQAASLRAYSIGNEDVRNCTIEMDESIRKYLSGVLDQAKNDGRFFTLITKTRTSSCIVQLIK